MTTITTRPFRFDPFNHEYIDVETGELIPHITGMLEATGLIDDRWYSEESSDRGTAVHRLTHDYDLGALDVASCVSEHRGYLLGHVAAMQVIPHAWDDVEVPRVHPQLRFGGRPDRNGVIYQAKGVLEVKSGGPEKSHAIQTAMQAILVAPIYGLPPEMLLRFALYLKPNGKFKLEEHKRKADFDEARRIIRRCT